MIEALLVLTLLFAAATAGFLAVLVLKEKSNSREAREELARHLATFSQTISAQMGSIAGVQNQQFETLRAAVEQRLDRIREDNSAKLEQI